MNKIGPPPNAEIDIMGTGTKIGSNNVIADASETGLPALAFGPMAAFSITRMVGGRQQQPVNLAQVKIPYGEVLLTISTVPNTANPPVQVMKWKKGDTELAVDTTNTTGKWPSALVTPAISATYQRLQYLAAGATTWTDVALTDLVKVVVQTNSA